MDKKQPRHITDVPLSERPIWIAGQFKIAAGRQTPGKKIRAAKTRIIDTCAHYYAGKQYAEALKLWDRFFNELEQIPIGAYTQAAACAYRLGKNSKLLHYCDTGLERYPNHKELLKYKALVLFHMGRREPAYTLAAQTYKLHPDLFETAVIHATDLCLQGKRMEARAILQSVLDITPNEKLLSPSLGKECAALEIALLQDDEKPTALAIFSNPKAIRIIEHQADVLRTRSLEVSIRWPNIRIHPANSRGRVVYTQDKGDDDELYRGASALTAPGLWEEASPSRE